MSTRFSQIAGPGPTDLSRMWPESRGLFRSQRPLN